MWCTIYLSKLPSMEKRVRVALEWTLDLIFAKDLVQFQQIKGPYISKKETAENGKARSSKVAVEGRLQMSGRPFAKRPALFRTLPSRQRVRPWCSDWRLG
jgi:hypothetical protein